MKKIEEQIKEQMNKAYFDIIDQTVNSETPDYEWLKNLYIEIRDRLCFFIKKESKVYKQIHNEFDVELFYQMITNDVFDAKSMYSLVECTFKWIENLQAPIRDESTLEAKNRVFKSESKKMISTFLKEVHICINNIEEDLQSYLSKID